MRVIRQKQQKPLAVDARCLLRAIDAVAARKSLKQAWIFSVRHIITPSRSCIHRKAINKDKPSLSSGCFCSITDRTDWLLEEREQKVCCFPWAYALAAR